MKQPICPVCSNRQTIELDLFPYDGYKLYHCQNCELKFLTTDSYEELDSDSYWDDVNKKIYSDPRVLAEFEKKHSKYLEKISTKKKRLLDIGSGNGIFVHNAIEAGFDATGVEPSVIAVSLCKEVFGIDLVQGYLTHDSALPRDFGVVTAWDVIEHVDSPKRFVEVCHAHLETGGVLLLETPNESCFFRKIVTTIYKLFRPYCKGLIKKIYYPSHRYYFTPNTLRFLLEEVGFNSVKTFKEHSMFSKTLLKMKYYGSLSRKKQFIYHFIFGVMRLPLFWNKQVTIAVKR